MNRSNSVNLQSTLSWESNKVHISTGCLNCKLPLPFLSSSLPCSPMAPSSGSHPVSKYFLSRSACPLVCGWPLQISTLSFFLFLFLSTPTSSVASGNSTTSATPIKPPSSAINTTQKFLIAAGAVSAFIIAVLVFMAYLFKCFGLKTKGMACRRRNGIAGDQVLPTTLEPFDPEASLGAEKSSVRRYKRGEIEKATKSFSWVIGEGGFSTVYLGNFSDLTIGAVKICRNSERLNRAFKQELDVLMHVRHPNIVKLLGYCDEGEEGVLVFEHISNGSLHEKLHGGGPMAENLSWARRMSIAYQLAGAIEHLHEKCDLQIVHCDIKASNILLDEQLNCKVCDFGFAKMGFSAAILPSSANPAVMGSPGYVDPHYLRTGIVSKKNDVYSFGVLVLELITGVEAFCEEKGKMLSRIVGHVLKEPERVVEVVDGRLGGEFDREEAVAMAAISAACLREQPSLRLSMADVLITMKEKISSIIPIMDKSKELSK